MKTCSKCHIEKDESQFFKDSLQKSGLRPDCKECRGKVNSIHHLKNKEIIKKQKKDYYIKNRDNFIKP